MSNEYKKAENINNLLNKIAFNFEKNYNQMPENDLKDILSKLNFMRTVQSNLNLITTDITVKVRNLADKILSESLKQ